MLLAHAALDWLLSCLGPVCFERAQWMLVDYTSPEFASQAAFAAERIQEFAQCRTSVQTAADGTAVALTFSSFADRPELTVPISCVTRIPGNGVGIFADIDLLVVREMVPLTGAWGNRTVYHLYLCSEAKGICAEHLNLLSTGPSAMQMVLFVGCFIAVSCFYLVMEFGEPPMPTTRQFGPDSYLL